MKFEEAAAAKEQAEAAEARRKSLSSIRCRAAMRWAE